MTTRDIVLVALFAAIIVVLGLLPPITLGFIPVPITAQSLGVMLAGSVLGARRGGLSLVLFLVLVATGLPLLAGGRGGLGVFAGPSVGFLLAWPVAAYVIGWLSERAGTTYKLHWGIVANLVGGIVVVYVGGIVGLAAVLGLSIPAAAVATWIYVPGDAVKVVIAALVARGVHAAYPGLLSRRRTEPAKEASTV
jgi:biotin transport system substrate-specific component